MTKDRDFKRLVRERAEETGETYTAARAALRQNDPLTDEALAKFRERFFAIRDNIENVVRGKTDVITLALTALVCGGHVLFEDVPGVRRTMLARAIGGSINGYVTRVQCTPDLAPSDLIGSTRVNGKSEPSFEQGPVFANVLLLDEIEHAAPRTQTAVMETIATEAITAAGTTHPLPQPFLVLASQHVIPSNGAHPLEQAQRDLFLLSLTMGYLTVEQEMELATRIWDGVRPIDELEAVADTATVLEMREIARSVIVPPEVTRLIVEIVRGTREHKALSVGASPRGSIALGQAASVFAALDGRREISDDDVLAIVHPVLQHRIVLSATAQSGGMTARSVVSEVIGSIT
jgi:MoxR-like ATPase